MDRLTIKNGIDGNYVHRNMCFYGVDGHIDDCDGCAEYCEGMEGECDGCAIQECFNRLAEYEDTGLTPEKILEMDGMYKELSREVMAYRKVGTVVEVKSMGRYSRLAKKHGTIGQAIDECAEYEAIGTVEECREAVEKQKLKKPIRIDMCTCPTCGTYNESIKKRRNTVNQDIVYCWHCGQAMEINRRDEGDRWKEVAG